MSQNSTVKIFFVEISSIISLMQAFHILFIY